METLDWTYDTTILLKEKSNANVCLILGYLFKLASQKMKTLSSILNYFRMSSEVTQLSGV